MTPHPSRRLITLFAGTVPKDPAFPESNEDKWRTCDIRQTYVLSDGAGDSYNSLLWSDVLVEEWFTAPPQKELLPWLEHAISEYESRSNTADMSWSQEAAFARGSFASLLGLQGNEDGEISVTAVGDSIALLVSSDGLIRWSVPYDRADQFRNRPRLLSTILGQNQAVVPCHASKLLWPGPRDRLLCVTDALGEWILLECAGHAERLQRVLNVASQDALATLVAEARASGTMRCDDTTLLVLGDASDGTPDC